MKQPHPAHVAADKIEPRLARAFVRASEVMRDRVSINDLAMAIAAKDVKRVMALIGNPKDAMAPAAAIVRDAFLRGGKIGAVQVNKALEAK